MVLQIIVMFDKALGAYSRPMFVPSRGVAVRSFSDEVNNSQSDLFRHPSDYELYYRGTFDDSTATFKVEELELVARGSDVFKEVS